MDKRLLNGFESKLTSSKWAKMAKYSQDTALRDINNLVNHRILIKETAGGRKTNYALVPKYYDRASFTVAVTPQYCMDRQCSRFTEGREGRLGDLCRSLRLDRS